MERFSSSIKGYNVNEVNKFVDDALKEYTSMLEKLKSKDAEIISLKQELEKYKTLSNMTETINMTYDTSNQIKELARNEARTIIDDAKKNASRIVNDALLEAEKIEMKADSLRRNMTVFKRRLRSALQTQLQTVEDIEEIKLED